ncbi:hypothetical protein M3Y99_00896500 [Aphelenchoides fujianensis]|nr:hypothetical protein M3Y99_00896500 [Aphelenchoides fujianensis]
MADFQTAAAATPGNAANGGAWPPDGRNFSPLVIPPAFSPHFAPLPSIAPASAPALVNFVSGMPPPHPPEVHENPMAFGAPPLFFAPFAVFPPSVPAQSNGFDFGAPLLQFAPPGGNSLHACPCCPIAFTCPIAFKRHVDGHYNSASNSMENPRNNSIGNAANDGPRNGRSNGARNPMANPGINARISQAPPVSFACPQMLPDRSAAAPSTATPVQPNGALGGVQPAVGAASRVCAAATPTGVSASPAAHSNSRGGSPSAHSTAPTAAAAPNAAAHEQLAGVNLNDMVEQAKRVHEKTNRLLERATARASSVAFDGPPAALETAPATPALATNTNVSSTSTPTTPAPPTNVLAANGALPVVPLSNVSSTNIPTASPSSVANAPTRQTGSDTNGGQATTTVDRAAAQSESQPGSRAGAPKDAPKEARAQPTSSPSVSLTSSHPPTVENAPTGAPKQPATPTVANRTEPKKELITPESSASGQKAIPAAMTTPVAPAASATPAPARPAATPAASNSTPMNQSNVSNRSRASWNETVRNLDSDLGSYWTNTSRVQSPERSKSPDGPQPAEYFSCCVEGCVYFFTRASSRNRHESASHGLERQPEDLAIRGMPTKEPKRHFVEPLPMRMPSPSPPRVAAPAPAVLQPAAKRIKREGEVGEPSGQLIAHGQPHQHQATPRPAPIATRHQAVVPQQPQALNQGRPSLSARPQVPPPLQPTAGSSAPPPPPPRVAATPRTPLARPQPAAQPAGVVAAPQRAPIHPAAAATHNNQQPAAMRPIKAEANANNAFVPPPQPLQSSTARCFKLLSQNPPIVYYDYQTMHELYGTAVIQMWKDVPECKVLLLRLEKDRWEQQQPELGDPVLTCSMIRYYLPRNENRNAHLSAYFKPSAAELAIKFSSEINSSLSFEELVTDVLPAMNTDTLVIAHPTEAGLLQNFDTRGTRLRIV